jgi:hypothetical protein
MGRLAREDAGVPSRTGLRQVDRPGPAVTGVADQNRTPTPPVTPQSAVSWTPLTYW